MKYYFVGASLPTIQLGAPLEITFEEFIRLLQENVVPSDYNQVMVLRRYYDLLNMRALWNGDLFDTHGNLDENALDDAILERIHLSPYIYRYLDDWESREDRLKHFPELLASFFREEVSAASGFLKRYLEFERKLRLVLVAFRAKQLQRSVEKELQFENPDEDFIAQILAQKDAAVYEPPEEFSDLKAMFQQHAHAPLELQFALSEYRFAKINQMLGVDTFSWERILGSLAQLIIAEQWLLLDKTTGDLVIDKLIKESA